MRNLRLLLPIVPIVFLAISLLALVVTGAGQSQAVQNWKDIILVVTSGLLTLTGAYTNTVVQSEMQIQHESRDLRRRLTSPYREYLEWLIKLAHRTDQSMAMKSKQENDSKEFGQTLQITDEERRKLHETMPPAWAHTMLANERLKKQLDRTFGLGIEYINETDIQKRKQLSASLRKECVKSLKQLERFEITG